MNFGIFTSSEYIVSHIYFFCNNYFKKNLIELIAKVKSTWVEISSAKTQVDLSPANLLIFFIFYNILNYLGGY